jgi:hypothetical protein
MEMDELRRRSAAILAAEERDPADWAEVGRLTSELQRQLRVDPRGPSPELVNHYLDDADIRARDEEYAAHQRRDVRRFVESGEYDGGRSIPLWTCALLLVLVASLALWLVL